MFFSRQFTSHLIKAGARNHRKTQSKPGNLTPKYHWLPQTKIIDPFLLITSTWQLVAMTHFDKNATQQQNTMKALQHFVPLLLEIKYHISLYFQYILCLAVLN